MHPIFDIHGHWPLGVNLQKPGLQRNVARQIGIVSDVEERMEVWIYEW